MSSPLGFDAGTCTRCGARLVLGVAWCQVCFTRVEEMDPLAAVAPPRELPDAPPSEGAGAHEVPVVPIGGSDAFDTNDFTVHVDDRAPSVPPDGTSTAAPGAATGAVTGVSPATETGDEGFDPGTGTWEAVRREGTWPVDEVDDSGEVPLTRREHRARARAAARASARRRTLSILAIAAVLAGAGTAAYLTLRPRPAAPYSRAQLAAALAPTISTVSQEIVALTPEFQSVATTGIATATQTLQAHQSFAVFTRCISDLASSAPRNRLARSPSLLRQGVSSLVTGCRSYGAAAQDVVATAGSAILVNTAQLDSDLQAASSAWNAGRAAITGHQ